MLKNKRSGGILIKSNVSQYAVWAKLLNGGKYENNFML